MSKPIVSVAMVVCNVDQFLAQAIESILNQTLAEFEFIIVDFGSTDKSKAIVASYAAKDSRIKAHEIPDCNLAEARNAACALAQGQYLAIMDADDVSLPGRLMEQVEFLNDRPLIGLLGGAVAWMDGAGNVVHSPWEQALVSPTTDAEIRSTLLTRNVFCQPSVMMRKEAFVRVGGYRAAFAPAEDYDLWLRISEHFEMASLENVVLQYRIHPGQVSVRKHTQQNLSSLAALASARSRRNKRVDSFASVGAITPEVLANLGVTEAEQQLSFAAGYMGWIQIMCAAGEWPAALRTGIEMLRSSSWRYLERRKLADMYVKVATLYWRNRRYLMGTITLGRAIAIRPMVMGRPLKPWLVRHRVGATTGT